MGPLLAKMNSWRRDPGFQVQYVPSLSLVYWMAMGFGTTALGVLATISFFLPETVASWRMCVSTSRVHKLRWEFKGNCRLQFSGVTAAVAGSLSWRVGEGGRSLNTGGDLGSLG